MSLHGIWYSHTIIQRLCYFSWLVILTMVVFQLWAYIIPLDERFHYPNRLAMCLNSERLPLLSLSDFKAVVAGCADPRNYLDFPKVKRFTGNYTQSGWAYSFFWNLAGQKNLLREFWGLWLEAFIGESMFTKFPRLEGSAGGVGSKVAIFWIRSLWCSNSESPSKNDFGAYRVGETTAESKRCHVDALFISLIQCKLFACWKFSPLF